MINQDQDQGRRMFHTTPTSFICKSLTRVRRLYSICSAMIGNTRCYVVTRKILSQPPDRQHPMSIACVEVIDVMVKKMVNRLSLLELKA